MDIVIRNYEPPDLPALKQLTVDAFENVSIDRNIQQQFGVIGGRDWQWRKARHIEQDVARDPLGTFVAVQGDQVVGYISTWIDREAGMGNIPNLAVHADQRGQGLGRRLIQYALDHFRRQGVHHARIETLQQNPVGQQLYPSCGFREVARQIHYCIELDPPQAPPPPGEQAET